MTHDEILEHWIPYRLQAIETLQFAWALVNETSDVRDLKVLINGKPRLRGNVATIANPMIEVGFIHARALLEFLGLCAIKGQLAQIKRRVSGDIAIENFSTSRGPLPMVHPDHALAAYPGSKAEAEAALVSIFELANKVLAHITDSSFSQPWTDQHLDIACRGIPVLLHNHLYSKLGRNIPKAPEALPNGR